MRGYSATELANNTGDVLLTAAGEPVEITRHGKPRFVLMTLDRYEKLLELAGGELAELDDASDLVADLDAELNNV